MHMWLFFLRGSEVYHSSAVSSIKAGGEFIQSGRVVARPPLALSSRANETNQAQVRERLQVAICSSYSSPFQTFEEFEICLTETSGCLKTAPAHFGGAVREQTKREHLPAICANVSQARLTFLPQLLWVSALDTASLPPWSNGLLTGG